MIEMGKTAMQIQAPAGARATPNVDYSTFTYIDKPLEYHYVVQPLDTIGKVAQMLYGVNNRITRTALRKQGFAPGAVVTNTH